MSPPLQCNLSPFSNDQWMVILCFSNGTNFIREFKCLRKILEFKNSLQPFHAFHFLHLPIWELGLKFCNFSVSQRWLSSTTSHAFSRSEIVHLHLQTTPGHLTTCLSRLWLADAHARLFFQPRSAPRNLPAPAHGSMYQM